MKVRTPKRPREWREAVDGAHAALVFDAARQYGLITGGPVIHVERCEEILSKGRVLGYLPRPAAIENFIRALAGPRKQ